MMANSLEEVMRRVAGCLLFPERRAKAVNFRFENCDPSPAFGDREQRQVLPDLVRYFKFWTLVVVACHR